MPDLHDLAPVVDTDTAWRIFERVARQRRTRRRVVAALATVAIVVAGIALVAVETNERGPRRVQVVGKPTVPDSTLRHLPVCAPSQLTATFGFVDNALEALGGVIFTNHTAQACTLTGRPDIRLITATGRYLPIQQTSENAGNTPSPPSPTRPVVLNAHARQPQAGVMLAWRNWCTTNPGPVVISVQFTTWHGNLVASPATNANANTVPPCIDQGRSTTISVGDVEAHDATGFDGSDADKSSTTTSTAPVPVTGPRTAAATIGYVGQLVAQHQLPHASAVTRVWADGPIIVVSTTLTNRTDAEDLYEKLSTATGCDDSFLFVRGQRVILADGSVVTAPRPGYRTCAGT